MCQIRIPYTRIPYILDVCGILLHHGPSFSTVLSTTRAPANPGFDAFLSETIIMDVSWYISRGRRPLKNYEPLQAFVPIMLCLSGLSNCSHSVFRCKNNPTLIIQAPKLSLPAFLDFVLFGKAILVLIQKFGLVWPIDSESEKPTVPNAILSSRAVHPQPVPFAVRFGGSVAAEAPGEALRAAGPVGDHEAEPSGRWPAGRVSASPISRLFLFGLGFPILCGWGGENGKPKGQPQL